MCVVLPPRSSFSLSVSPSLCLCLSVSLSLSLFVSLCLPVSLSVSSLLSEPFQLLSGSRIAGAPTLDLSLAGPRPPVPRPWISPVTRQLSAQAPHSSLHNAASRALTRADEIWSGIRRANVRG